MGVGMAASLVKAGFNACGYDVYEPSIQKFVAGGGKAIEATSPAEAAREAEVLVLMVQNAAQAEDVLFGAGAAAKSLPDGSIVILNSTVSPTAVRDLSTRLSSLGKGLELIDAPVSGGVARAAKGELTLPRGCVVVVNTAAEEDMAIFAAGAISAEKQGKRY
ncbi:hypothetical protein VC83_08036 [Pseudogymnoascus destructans]|nr:uncharacterized protein VC83_08036 [Pseudogymnoascus destructans]OAF55860.1 hypothetical protein VC83_08036 [Pseudogymnoascus destructans]